MKLTASQYHEHVGFYDGFCEDCDSIGREGSTEPDITPNYEGYACHDCGGSNVWGIEMAFCAGKIEIVEGTSC